MMKKKHVFAVFCLILSALSVQAQRNDKGFFVEGTLSMDTRVHDNCIVLSPAVGYQFNNKIAGGFKARFRTKGQYSSSLAIYTLFMRYNYLTLSRFQLFAEAQGNYYDSNTDGGRSDVEEVGLSFGTTYALHKNVNLVAQYLFLGWSNDRFKGDGWLDSGDFGLDANLWRFQLGVQVVF